MKRDIVLQAVAPLETALGELKTALAMLDAEKGDESHWRVHADAVIKRFEVAFEYCWKLMKVAAEYQGGDAPGPRPAIQEAVRFGWVDDPDFWAEALDARNDSIHDYFGIGKREYVDMTKRFLPEAEKMLGAVKRLLG